MFYSCFDKINASNYVCLYIFFNILTRKSRFVSPTSVTKASNAITLPWLVNSAAGTTHAISDTAASDCNVIEASDCAQIPGLKKVGAEKDKNI